MLSFCHLHPSHCKSSLQKHASTDLGLAGNVSNQGSPGSTISIIATVAELDTVGQPHGLAGVGSAGKAVQVSVADSALDEVHQSLVDLGQADEVPATSSIVEDVAVAASVVLSKAHAAHGVAAAAPREVGVNGGSIERRAGQWSTVVTLVVVGLALEEGNEDVGGVVEGQLVQPVVLGAETSQPGARGSLDEHSALDGGAGALAALVGRVVSNPGPEVVDVGRRTGGKVEAEVGSPAVGLAAAADGGVTGTANGVERVEDCDITRVVASHVDSEEDGTGESLVDGEADVLDVSHALLAGGRADLDNGSRVGLGRESTAGSGNGRPSLTIQLSSGRDGDGRLDDVDAEGQVGDLALAGGGVESTLEGGSVVGEAIALEGVSTVLVGVLQVDNVGNGLVGILRGVDDGVSAARSKRSRPVHGLGRRVRLVHGVGATGVSIDVGAQAG